MAKKELKAKAMGLMKDSDLMGKVFQDGNATKTLLNTAREAIQKGKISDYTLRASTDMVKPKEAASHALDMDNDGRVTSADALQIARYELGIDKVPNIPMQKAGNILDSMPKTDPQEQLKPSKEILAMMGEDSAKALSAYRQQLGLESPTQNVPSEPTIRTIDQPDPVPYHKPTASDALEAFNNRDSSKALDDFRQSLDIGAPAVQGTTLDSLRKAAGLLEDKPQDDNPRQAARFTPTAPTSKDALDAFRSNNSAKALSDFRSSAGVTPGTDYTKVYSDVATSDTPQADTEFDF